MLPPQGRAPAGVASSSIGSSDQPARPSASWPGPRTSAGVSGRYARGERRVGQGADARAHQPADLVADGLAHAPDLAVAALVDDDAEDPGRDHAHPGRRGRRRPRERPPGAACAGRPAEGSPATSTRYSLTTPWEGWLSSWARSPSLVRTKQALAVGVEAPDREDPRLGRHEVDHGRAALGVIGRGDHAGGLVEQVVDEARAPPARARRRRPSGRSTGRRGGRARPPRRPP